jgi:hypothetical protein
VGLAGVSSSVVTGVMEEDEESNDDGGESADIETGFGISDKRDIEGI